MIYIIYLLTLFLHQSHAQDRKLAVDLVDYLSKQVEIKKPIQQPEIQPTNKPDPQKGKEQDR